jgi:flagellar basal-body rod protein FlgB
VSFGGNQDWSNRAIVGTAVAHCELRNSVFTENTMINDTKIMELLEAGVNAEGVRLKTLANNIANINTPGYRRYDVKFQDVLAKAIESQDQGLDSKKLEPEFFQPKNTPVDGSGNDVHLDHEVGEMVKNSAMHTAYTLLIKKKYEQMRSAIQIS